MKNKKRKTNRNVVIGNIGLVITLFLFLILLYRGSVLSLSKKVDGINLKTFSKNHTLKHETITAKRGNIYDANGTPTNIPNESVGTWYDYDKRTWANIVTKNGGEIAYWTYIPRYEYIENTGTKTTAIHFIPVTKEQADEGWSIPESFNFGGKQLKGFWASKYEVQ